MNRHHLQQRVQQRVDELVDSGQETGVQVAAYLHGAPIVDAVAGLADPATGRAVTPGTPFFSFSTGKALTSTVVHVLAEQGRLDYDLRLAEVWPEFARNGKSGVTLRHVLTHTAGLPALPPDVTAADLADWGRMCAILADTAPEWEPGTAHGYHVWTYGWLVGETVRRVTGRTLSQVLATDVAAPLGVPGELLLRVPDEDLDRLAVLDERSWSDALKQLSAQLPNFDRAVPHGARPDADLGNDRSFLRAEVPAVGTITARAAARMFAALLGEVDGVRLISPARLREATRPVTRGPVDIRHAGAVDARVRRRRSDDRGGRDRRQPGRGPARAGADHRGDEELAGRRRRRPDGAAPRNDHLGGPGRGADDPAVPDPPRVMRPDPP
ncbi:serine hydrolase domain-containing protein [Catellatospora coxensis]